MTRQHTSYSQLNTWLECGERYRLQYVEDVEQQPAWWTIGGKAIHSITEDIDKNTTTWSTLTPEVIGQYIDNAYADTVGLISQPFLTSKQDKDYWIKNIPSHIEQWTEWIKQSQYGIIQNKQGKKAVELEVIVDILGTPFKGYVDRIVASPSGLAVLDIKTGTKQPDNPLQLAFYRYAVKKQYGIELDKGIFFMTKNGKVLEYDLSGYTDKIIETMITQLAVAKDNNVYIPKEGSGCFICPVRKHCTLNNIGLRS